jgi:hypothetical protein
MLLGAALLSFSSFLFIFSWDNFVLAVGLVFFVVAYIGLNLLAEPDTKTWHISDLLTLSGFITVVVGSYLDVWLAWAIGNVSLLIFTRSKIINLKTLSAFKRILKNFIRTTLEIAKQDHDHAAKQLQLRNEETLRGAFLSYAPKAEPLEKERQNRI